MTVVDSRGRRTPPSVRGRQFSGPPKGRLRRGPEPSGRPGPIRTLRSDRSGQVSRRPGAAVIWVLALLGGLLGMAIGATQHDATGQSLLLGYVISAAVAAGLVRRGRSLRLLVCCLPLTLVVSAAVASTVALDQGGSRITMKSTLAEVGQILVLHSPWLWGGTLLAVIVGARRGLLRRRPNFDAQLAG